jgi:transposase-like protein
MNMTETNLPDWQILDGTEEACAQALAQQCRPEGFRCPRCGHYHGCAITSRHSYECSKCHYQASFPARTLFHSTELSLTKWFWTIYLAASDNDGISAMWLAKQIGISWISASRMLRKIRIAMGHRDSSYRLQDLVEINDALIGGRRIGKRRSGAEGKSPVLVVVENRGQRAGYIAM